MAATSPPLPSFFRYRRKILSNFTSFKPFSIILQDEKCSRFRCQIKSFENQPPNWSVEFLSGTESINLIQNSPSSMSMAALSASDSTVKTFKKVCLFYCDETKALAERIAAESDAIELRSINWRTFEDGFPNLFIPNAHGIRGKNVAFLASFSSPSVIFEQLSVIYALPKLFISSFTLVLPFFPTGTSERMEDEGDVATAFTLARILSNIPTSRGGPTSLVTFDIHALQERFYFGDNILPCFESGIPLLMNRLQQLPDSDKISIAFPDDGAWKRFHKQLQHFPTIICNKVRIGDKRIVRIKEGEAAGRHVVIVDDLVQSGGTLIECQRALAANGAAKISAYVTHGIFPNRSWQRFEPDNGGHPENGLTYFWITDSCPRTVNEISIAFPDDGAWKRFHKQLQHFPTIICNKVRIGDKRIVRIKEGEAAGRHVVIVDDLVQSGGTLIECQRALAANGAAKISAYVTHGIFPNRSWQRFEPDNGGHPENGLTYFWITDSCPRTVNEVMNKSPFEILSLAGSIAAALQI